MSNIIGIVVVVLLIGFLAAFGLAGRGTFGGKSIAELPLTDDGVRIELAPASGPLRFVIHGVYRTTITGGPRTNRYRASLSLGETEIASREVSITVSQDTKLGQIRNSTTALEVPIDRAGTYVFKLMPSSKLGNPIVFSDRTLTVRAPGR